MIGIDALVDGRSGLIRDVVHGRCQGVLHTATAQLAETEAFALPLGNPVVAGSSWTDPARARVRAVGEAVERYAGHLIDPRRLRRATWHELAGQAVDPESLALHAPGGPFTGLRRDDELSWVRGALTDGRPCWVPASLVWLAPGPHAVVRGGPAHLPIAAGIAAGPTLEVARDGAFAEVVERHALATAWHAGHAFARLDPVPVPVPADVELTWRSVPNRCGKPVVLCTALAPGDRLGIGCAAGAEAAAKAAAEALRSMDALDAVIEGVPEWEAVLHPHRADRRYTGSYRPDLSDATDLACTLQLLADPAFAAAVLDRLDGGTPAAAAPDLPLQPVTVDLTPPDVAALGWTVVRVVVPGTRSVGPAAYPFVGDGLEPLPPVLERLPVPHA